MKRFILFSFLVLSILMAYNIHQVGAVRTDVEQSFLDNVRGKILLQVESAGEAWYINPKNDNKYYLGKPTDAFSVMRSEGIGISNADLNKIPVARDYLNGLELIDSDEDGFNDREELESGYNPNGEGILNHSNTFAQQQSGRILLQVENKGEAWYVNPADNKRYYLGRPADAFAVMRNLGLGISNENLNMIANGNNENSAENPNDNEDNNEDNNENGDCVGLSKCLKYKNVEIAWEVPDDAFEYVVGASESKEVSSQHVDRSINYIKKALDKYPAGMLKRYLNRIYLLDSLSLDDRIAGGTVDTLNRRIFIVPNIYSDNRTLEQIVHHEFAHILSANPDNSYWLVSSFKEEFDAINTDKIPYGKENINNIGNVHSTNPVLAENAYLTYYSAYSIEEDIAQMAGYMFKNNDDTLRVDFWELIDSNSKLKEKFELMVKFYSERDPEVFNEEYFRRVSQE